MPRITERRSMLHIVIKLNSESTVNPVLINIINTHLGVNPEERKRQFPYVLRTLRNIKGPAVFLGDLNMEDKDPLLKDVFPEWRKIHLSPPSPTIITGKEIDHIYVNFSTKFATAWTIDSNASDHFPVLAQFPINMIH